MVREFEPIISYDRVKLVEHDGLVYTKLDANTALVPGDIKINPLNGCVYLCDVYDDGQIVNPGYAIFRKKGK